MVVTACDEALGASPSYGTGCTGDASRLRAPIRAKGKAAALLLFSDAAHNFISTLIFQVENLVKTKN